MAEVRKDKRYGESVDNDVRTLEEPMEATLADRSGSARMTWTITGSREAAGRWLTGTVEFAGFGVQVYLDAPMLRLDACRTFAQELWQIADKQEGQVVGEFPPNLTITVRCPSKLAARLEAEIEFEMGDDADVQATLQIEGTMTLAFVEALDRALEAVEDLGS